MERVYSVSESTLDRWRGQVKLEAGYEGSQAKQKMEVLEKRINK
jgi:hypothetical protein